MEAAIRAKRVTSWKVFMVNSATTMMFVDQCGFRLKLKPLGESRKACVCDVWPVWPDPIFSVSRSKKCNFRVNARIFMHSHWSEFVRFMCVKCEKNNNTKDREPYVLYRRLGTYLACILSTPTEYLRRLYLLGLPTVRTVLYSLFQRERERERETRAWIWLVSTACPPAGMSLFF